jgi:translation initiation factor 5B
MAPKKKGGKKQADDWEADLGETIDPIAQATEDAEKADAAVDGEADGAAAGGLLAALRKNKNKRAKKGKLDNDFVEGEDPAQTGPHAPEPEANFNDKAPEEATFDDEDIFADTGKKGKGGRKQAEKPAPEPADDDDEEGGGLKSKKEKEKEKKEREKQRKKEQVRSPRALTSALN